MTTTLLFPDVNVLLLGHRPDASPERGEQTRTWVETALRGGQRVAVSEQVLTAVIRLATNRRIFRHPSPPGDAIDYAEAVLAAPATVVVRPGARHWPVFAGLVREHELRANDVPDAYLAALAIEHGATAVTWDRGLARYSPLVTTTPVDDTA